MQFVPGGTVHCLAESARRRNERPALEAPPHGVFSLHTEPHAGESDFAHALKFDPPGREQEAAADVRSAAGAQQEAEVLFTLRRDYPHHTIPVELEARHATVAEGEDEAGNHATKRRRKVMERHGRSIWPMQVRPTDLIGIRLDREPEP